MVNPNYYDKIYGASPIRAAIERGAPALSIALLGAILKENGHIVETFDMNLNNYSIFHLIGKVEDLKPDIIGFTMTTPLFFSVKEYCNALRKASYEGVLLAGGPHPTALPYETLSSTGLDYIIASQADILIKKLAGGELDYKNIWKKHNGSIEEGDGELKEDLILDDLPYPIYNPKDIPKYTQPKVSIRNRPFAHLETSRGCFGQCIFCDKKIHGFKFKAKSPQRVVDEMEYLLKIGFKELQIVDDGFTTDIDRVIEICEEILRRGLKFTWHPRGGLRVDRVSLKMFQMMKKAGCYKVPFGVESGSPRMLKIINKGISLEQVEEAVLLAKDAGLETDCYFMIGLPTETEEDVIKSFKFAKKVSPDYIKFAVTIPLPGTKLFNDLKSQNRILTENWDLYNYSACTSELYVHDTMSADTIYKLYKKLNRAYYFRLPYILRHGIKSIKRKSLVSDIKSAFKLSLS